MLGKIYQVCAFTKERFSGNPASICCVEKWANEKELQSIALENNMPVTSFLIVKDESVLIRWFTPEYELSLCAHGVLAAAHVLFSERTDKRKNEIVFIPNSQKKIQVFCDNGRISFKLDESTGTLLTDELKVTAISQALNVAVQEIYISDDRAFAILENEEMVVSYQPDYERLCRMEFRGITLTSRSSGHDFVSRTFYPKKLFKEDPVCGSAHCFLTPYWIKNLNKIWLLARQGSSRGGEIECQMDGNQVLLSGYARTYWQGTLL